MTRTPAPLPAADRRRRQLLVGSAAAGLAAFADGARAQAAGATPAASAASAPAAAAGPKPLPAYVAWKDPAAMIVHTSSTLETKRSAFGTSIVTPADQLYIRNNLPAPGNDIVADRNAWQVAVEGVKKPRGFTVAELKNLGLETVAMVLQCSGNGRGYFPNKPSGTPWQVGAAGCVVWSGVPVRAVIEACGGLDGDKPYMTGTGGEKLPEGVDPLSVMVERSVPAGASADALLAWEMNGAPIPLAHGGPLRLVVPGYNGVNNVKYIKRLAFTDKQSMAKIQQSGYRLSPPGTTGNPDQPSIWEMAPKSWINSPDPAGKPVAAGLVQVKGVGFGGMHGVKVIDVSIDGGKTWKAARLVGPDLGKYAWRQFVLPVQLPAGTHVLMSRVTDVQGNQQPELRTENTSGYINSSWRDHALTVTVA